MIFARLLVTAGLTRRRRAARVGLMLVAVLCGAPPLARAQGVEGGYLPSGGGTFIPFRGGPGGGLGVMPSGPRTSSAGASPGASSLMGAMGSGPTLGVSNGLSPLRPIGVLGTGMGTGGFLRRAPNAAGMGKSMPRPPVGYYPFRIPPSLRGPSTAGPSMAM